MLQSLPLVLCRVRVKYGVQKMGSYKSLITSMLDVASVTMHCVAHVAIVLHHAIQELNTECGY